MDTITVADSRDIVMGSSVAKVTPSAGHHPQFQQAGRAAGICMSRSEFVRPEWADLSAHALYHFMGAKSGGEPGFDT